MDSNDDPPAFTCQCHNCKDGCCTAHVAREGGVCSLCQQLHTHKAPMDAKEFICSLCDSPLCVHTLKDCQGGECQGCGVQFGKPWLCESEDCLQEHKMRVIPEHLSTCSRCNSAIPASSSHVAVVKCNDDDNGEVLSPVAAVKRKADDGDDKGWTMGGGGLNTKRNDDDDEGDTHDDTEDDTEDDELRAAVHEDATPQEPAVAAEDEEPAAGEEGPAAVDDKPAQVEEAAPQEPAGAAEDVG